MNQLTFGDGTFAGKTIRTTSDGYASIYDVMRVAGVGDEPTNTWNRLKTMFLADPSTSGTSDSRQTAVKTFKFSGRGQRDTPVINGPGLVRLLFLLPGVNARKFVAESAETLVRHLGGDETLVEQIRHNREIAQQNQDSAQAFMAQNIPTTSAPTSLEVSNITQLEMDERRARLIRMEEENKTLKLQVLQQYEEYALSHINDPRIKELVQNEIVNQVLLGINPQLSQRRIGYSEGGNQLDTSALITVDQTLTEMGLRMTTAQKSTVGRDVAAKYRREHPGTVIETVEKFVNGEMRKVRAYPRAFEDSIKTSIRNHL